MKTKHIIFFLTAVVLTALLGGCLNPYESDYACPYSEGYGKCLGAKENYELSQMSAEERNRLLNKKGENAPVAFNCEAERKRCGCLDESENQCSDFDYEQLQTLKVNGCLSAQEIVLLDNHNSLLNLQRLVLDRKAIEERMPEGDKNATAAIDGNMSEEEENDLFAAVVSNDESNSTENKDTVTITISLGSDANGSSYVSNIDVNRADDANATIVCGYDRIEKGVWVEILVHRAWLRNEPDAAYPPKSGIEAKRGDKFSVVSNDTCGWLKLDNDRFIHQSIVKVIK